MTTHHAPSPISDPALAVLRFLVAHDRQSFRAIRDAVFESERGNLALSNILRALRRRRLICVGVLDACDKPPGDCFLYYVTAKGKEAAQ